MASPPPAPALTVITPVLNQVQRIRRAVESVKAQAGVSWEHVVVDGGSTDGTLDVLRAYPHLRVVSGPDDGVYDAINKGVRIAEGAVIGHLNSDDVFLPGALGKAVAALARTPDAESACGGVEIVAGEAPGPTAVVATYDDEPVKRLRPYDIARGVPITNGRFFRRALYERIGGYDPSFQIAADREFLLRAILAGMRTVPLDGLVYRYVQHPGSLTMGAETDVDRNVREYLRICQSFLRRPGLDPDVDRELRLWAGRDTGRRVRASLRSRRIDEAARWMWRGFRVDVAWPVWYRRELREPGAKHAPTG